MEIAARARVDFIKSESVAIRVKRARKDLMLSTEEELELFASVSGCSVERSAHGKREGNAFAVGRPHGSDVSARSQQRAASAFQI